MPIQKFSRANVRHLMDEIEEALRPIAEKHGLTLDRKGRSFYRDRVPVMFQMLITEKDEDGNALDAKAKAFKNRAQDFGLDPDDLGREFSMNGMLYRITGLNPRARRYPVTGERVHDGKSFKFPAEAVSRGLRKVA